MDVTRHPVQFRGETVEYFGIWIVNILLTIVTFGIYSAWAKVRNRRFFAQNTLIDGRRFDYHATGGQILKGRLIVIAGLIVLQIPFVQIAGFIALIIALPWLFNSALAFNARNTSFSGLRFAFSGSYWGAFRAYLLYPTAAALTLYLAMPFAARARHRYAISNHRFGAAAFAFHSPIGPFYKAFLISGLWAVGILAVGMGLTGGLAALFEVISAARNGTQPSDGAVIGVMLLYVSFLVAVLPVGAIYAAYTRNAVYAAVSLDGGGLGGTHSVQSFVSPLRLVWISISNAFVVALSSGMALPWARVRMARYLASCTAVLVAGSMDDFVTGRTDEVSALGDAYGDFEGVDLGLTL